MGKANYYIMRWLVVCLLIVVCSSTLYAYDERQPYQFLDSIQNYYDDSTTPSWVRCFCTVFNYYHDQGSYKNRDTGANVSLTNPDEVKGWINNQPWWESTIDQLYDAAAKLNVYNAPTQPYYVVQKYTISTDSNSERIAQLNYIVANYLKNNRPVILSMKSIVNITFYVVLTGYDATNATIHYYYPLDPNNHDQQVSYTDFIQNYFFNSWFWQRWDGRWIGFKNRNSLAGDHRVSFNFSGNNRSYEIHVPKKYIDSQYLYSPTKAALVLDFHGIFQNASVERSVSGFAAKSDEVGFIVVYPEAPETPLGRAWNIFGVPDWTDDIGFSVKVVDDVKNPLNIDANRVYLTGLSNGGSMALRCAYVNPGNVFKGVAAVSAFLVGDTPSTPASIPVINFQSYDDELVNYNLVVAASKQWAIWKGCDVNNPVVDNTIGNTIGKGDEYLTKYCPDSGVQLYMLHSFGDSALGFLGLANCDNDPHCIYQTNFHGTTKETRKAYITNNAWNFLSSH